MNERMFYAYHKDLPLSPSRRPKFARFRHSKLYVNMLHVRKQYKNNEEGC